MKTIPITLTPELEAAFWANVDTSPDGCWPWTGATDRDGYGILAYKGTHYRANRIALAIRLGEDPGELLGCHSCDMPGCARPDCIFPGTLAENKQDEVSKGRHARGPRHAHYGKRGVWMEGERNPVNRDPSLRSGLRRNVNKLQPAQVVEIRRLHADEQPTCKSLAERFAISETQIRRIIKGTHWTGVAT